MVFSGGQRSRTAEKFGASGVAWMVRLLPDRKIFRHIWMDGFLPDRKFGAFEDAPSRNEICGSFKAFTFAFVQVIIDADKSDGCGENGKEID